MHMAAWVRKGILSFRLQTHFEIEGLTNSKAVEGSPALRKADTVKSASI